MSGILTPANAALGLLVLGAIASVFFIFVSADTDVTTAVTNSITIAKRKGISNMVEDVFENLLVVT